MDTIANDYTINIATANGTGSQSANLILLQSLFEMGVPVSGKNLFPSNIQDYRHGTSSVFPTMDIKPQATEPTSKSLSTLQLGKKTSLRSNQAQWSSGMKTQRRK